MILAELIADCSLQRFFAYLAMARGEMNGPFSLAETLLLEALKLSFWHWVYRCLVFFSGLFVGINYTQPMYDGRNWFPKSRDS